MRCANEMADILARTAADGGSIGQPGRERLRAQLRQAKELAIFVGRLTYEAGAHKMANGELARDSAGCPGHLPRRVSRAKAKPTSRASLPSEDLYQRSAKLAGIRERIMRKA